jgi:hypothetical protein
LRQAFCDGGRPLQYDVLSSLLRQVIADRQSSLATADDHGVDPLSVHSFDPHFFTRFDVAEGKKVKQEF